MTSSEDVMGKPASVLLSLKQAGGTAILNDIKVGVTAQGSELVTDAMELLPGTYIINDVLVLDDEDNILYASPVKRSALAGMRSFSLSASARMEVQVDVVSAHQSFRVSLNAGGTSVTGAYAFILDGTDTLATQWLDEAVNTIQFSGDQHSTYELVVVKDGYGKYTRDFEMKDLKKDLGNNPLEISLTPALTFRFHTLPTRFRYSLAILFPAGTTGNITVDWGDGTVEPYAFEHNEIGHVYKTKGDYFLSITGDVANIIEVFYYYNDEVTSVSAMNFEHLSDLEFLAIGWAHVPAVIDLSHNTKIEAIDFSDLLELNDLILPASHFIRYFNLSGDNGVSASEISDMIHSIYVHASQQGTMNGLLNLTDETGSIAGPPSPEAMEELRQLRDVYGWRIEPAL
jgi:hypothetical protein